MERQVSTATAFSIWDAALVAASILGGMLFVFLNADFFDENLHQFEHALLGTTLGLIFLGPFVVISRWFQGRSLPLRFGEWLWLTPLAPFLFTFSMCVLAGGRNALFIVFFLYIPSQFLASTIAFFLTFRRNILWTERVGSFTCFLTGLIWAVNLILHPLEL